MDYYKNMGYICGLFKIKYQPHASGNKMRANRELFSIGFSWQKMNYMHNNPVDSGLVEKPEDYLYSSARDYVGKGKGLLDIHPI